MADDPNLEPIINLMNEYFVDESSFKTFVVSFFISKMNKLNFQDTVFNNIVTLVKEIYTDRDIPKILDIIREKNKKLYEEYRSKYIDFFEVNEPEIVKNKYQEAQAINELEKYLTIISFEDIQKIYLSIFLNNALKKPENINSLLTELNRSIPSQQHRYLIPFVVQVKQTFPQINQKLENWLFQYNKYLGDVDFLKTSKPIPIDASSSPVNSSESSLLIEINQPDSHHLELQAWFWSSQSCRLIQEHEK